MTEKALSSRRGGADRAGSRYARRDCVERCSPRLADAADRGARLVVFPGTFVPWYPYFSFVHPPVSRGRRHPPL